MTFNLHHYLIRKLKTANRMIQVQRYSCLMLLSYVLANNQVRVRTEMFQGDVVPLSQGLLNILFPKITIIFASINCRHIVCTL